MSCDTSTRSPLCVEVLSTEHRPVRIAVRRAGVTVLLAVDRPGAHDRLVRTGVELAEGLGASLHVVHFVGAGVPDEEARAFKRDLEAELGELTHVDRRVSLEHVPDRGRRPGTKVGNAILELAADVEYDHIVVGHRRTGTVAQVVSKSVAHRVIDRADVPVTVVQEPAE